MLITNYILFLESKKLGRIVLTGSPGTGKTEVLKLLRDMKYHVVPEPARDLLKRLKSSDQNWFSNLQRNPVAKNILHIIPNDGREAFQQMVEKQNIFNHNRNQNGFFDRGLVDEIGFRRFYKKEISQKLIKDCNKYRYDKVFFFEPWKEIYVNDNERKEPFEQAESIGKYLLEGYKEFGYNPIIVPKESINDRVKFILDNLK
jgi:predicted ATPase